MFYLSLFSYTSGMFQVRLLRRRLNERFLKVWSGFFVPLYPSDVTLFDYCPITVCPWLFLLGFAMFDNVPISPYILDVETVSLPSLVAFLGRSLFAPSLCSDSSSSSLEHCSLTSSGFEDCSCALTFFAHSSRTFPTWTHLEPNIQALVWELVSSSSQWLRQHSQCTQRV